MERHLPSLNLLSVVLFLAGVFMLVPSEKWIALLPYLAIIAFLSKFLYDILIKPNDPGFSPSLFSLSLIHI